ncbi:MAG: response regulator [Anaerolineae bacterium]|nr:response regulator [Anaerolineae bacterium]
MLNHENNVEILMVEDNPNDEELALHALKSHNLAGKIEVLHDGEEALDYMFCTGKFKSRQIKDAPKIILLDIKLPKINGLDVLKKLKEDERTKHIPVVVLTSSNQEKDIIKSYQLGVNSYIVKPVDYDNFTDTVKQIGQYWLITNESPA